MRYTTLCYIENPAGEYLMLHRVKKENDQETGLKNGRINPKRTSIGTIANRLTQNR